MKRPIRLYALHSFLGLPSDWDFLGTSHTAVDVFNLCPFPTTLRTWTTRFLEMISPEHDNILLGYSLGGRLALHALTQRPDLWKAGVIISAHPGLKTQEEREQKKKSDLAWAQRFLSDPWDPLMADWNKQSVFAKSLPLDRKEAHFDRQQLADILTYLSLGHQEDLQDAIEHLDIPLLWLTGAYDVKYSSLAHKLVLRHPLSQVAILNQVGHRITWDAPQQFKKELIQFLNNIYEGKYARADHNTLAGS